MSSSSAAPHLLKQLFRNKTDKPVIINLELSTARYRLLPGEELVLHYSEGEQQNAKGLETEIINAGDAVELVVWTGSDVLYHVDGTAAAMDYEP